MALAKIPSKEYEYVYQWAKQEGLIEDLDSAIYFYSLDLLDSRLDHLSNIFPPGVHHAIAIKTNPLIGILRHIQKRGFGLEAASMEEVYLAQAANCHPSKIVFDSPVKRRQELHIANAEFQGMTINANCLEELPRIQQIKNLRKGLRINPLLNTGAPEVFDVSSKSSKFGVPISERAAIIQSFLNYPDLEGLHMHIGSQISRLDATAKAIKVLYQLADEIKAARKDRGIHTELTYMDIGGGFPANYIDQQQLGMEQFVAYIKHECAQVFESYQVITEFGRFVHAHNGWVLSDIEFITDYQATPIAMIHTGADMFVREIYQPGSPIHHLAALDREGNLKKEDLQAYHLGGPLCFAGDFIDHQRQLPNLKTGDKLVIADAGANSIGMWSRHCSRACPKAIAYSLKDQSIRVIKKREAVKDIVRFWQ